jgi:glycosyltransferase involved in cell wall biosynthesis
MVVDNHVDGDSRVQKVARSAAAAGWDVVLVGRSRTSEVVSYDLGGAEVRLIPVPMTLLSTPQRVPGRRWRWPLAYASRERSTYRARRIDGTKARLVERRTDQKLRGASPLTRVGTKALNARIKGQVLTHKVRNDQLTRAIKSRKDPDGRLARTGAALRTRLAPRTAWRSLDPFLVDLGLAFEPVLHELKPDLIHAHDFRMSGLAVRVAEQRRARGHSCAVVYDAHEFLPGVRYRTRTWHLGNEQHESLYVPRADAVVTVSETLAEMLQERHHLKDTPTVVLNAPAPRPEAEAPGGGVRAVCGLADDVPLLVYAGSSAPQRGLHDVVRALALLPAAHAAFVIPDNKERAALRTTADEVGVADRVHLVDYVAQDLVVPFLRSADVGLIPIHHHLNHEIALITKYFDYSLADLPIVTSDVRTMGGVTREVGNGEVFTAADPTDLARAVQQVLDDPARYRKAYTPEVLEAWTWQAQERVLLSLYDRLVP